jgi:transducin (beta)-like 1
VCDESFSVLTPHICSVKRKRKLFDPIDVVDEDFGPLEIPFKNATQLRGHDAIVTACAWNPKSNIVATGSSDGGSRLWDLDSADVKTNGGVVNGAKVNAIAASKQLSEAKSTDSKSLSMDVEMDTGSGVPQTVDDSVVCMSWNSPGTRLCTGFFSGQIILHSSTGQVLRTLRGHKGPVTACHWNPATTSLLSGSVDNAVIVWNSDTGEVKQRFEHHDAPVVDVNWRNERDFASCSIDGSITVCTVGRSAPVRKFASAHESDVNMIRWDPSGAMLASCSDDGSVKVWTAESKDCLHTLAEHEREVCVIDWSPSGISPSGKSMLASGSYDGTIKLWDAHAGGASIKTLDRHAHPITAIQFHPSKELLAVASHDRVHLWNAKSGSLVRTFKASSGVNSLSWDYQGNHLIAGMSDFTCVLLDVRLV